MRARHLYFGVMVPLALWVLGDAVLSLWRTGLDLNRMPTLVERALLALGLWSVRALPFGIVVGVLAAPVLTLVAAWLVRSTRAAPPLTVAVLPWLFVCLASWASVFLVIWMNRWPSAAMLLFWSGSLGQALALATAYRVQVALERQGLSRVRGSTVLWVGVGGQVLMRGAWLLALVVPGWAEWQPTGRAVEQGDEADEAFGGMVASMDMPPHARAG